MSRELPEGWVTAKLGEISRPRQWPTIPKSLFTVNGYVVYGANGPIGKYISYTHEHETIAITCRGATCGSVNLVPPFSYITGNAMALDELNTSFVEQRFLYQMLIYNGFDDVISGSAQPQITGQAISAIMLQLPPLHEQRRVSEILSSVDEAIAATQAVIEQTKKVKQATLERLLTKGIGHIRFKQTEIGEIPDTWDVARIGDISIFVTSGSRGWAAYYAEQGAAFIRITNLSRDNIRMKLDEIQRVNIPAGSTEGARTRLKIGDILISITADLGVIGLVSDTNLGEAYVNQHIALVRPLEREVSSTFLAYALSSSISQKRFQQMNDAGAKAGLNLTTIRSFLVSLPPLEEQIQIAEKATLIDRVIESNKIRLSDLKALKSALMSDLLTGRKRVTDTLPLAAE